MILVGIVIGSETDKDIIKSTTNMLEQLDIAYELSTISGHRNPDKLRKYSLEAEKRGLEVIIAAAGKAAHLPGILASWTTLPVIGIPIAVGELNGIDSLFSIVQMPGGVPVACVGIGTSGAKNAALLAAQILGVKYTEIRRTYLKYKANLAEG
ncbi:MAG: 5-(carboxyamino)imidazole ribonucleotide mutase [Dehalococcoidia bacterium]|nr:5-(carboxyamino)imidazole ribonucleotide mutase [Dehalococcoidia bacterium]